MSDETDQPEVSDDPTFVVSDKLYNRLRFLMLILLPGIGALYFGVAQIWGLPKAEEVVGTIVVIDTFGGLLLRSLRKAYEKSDARFDGVIVVEPGEMPGTSQLNVGLSSEAIEGKDEVLVKVKKDLS